MPHTYEPVGFCPTCGYRMDAGRCPECGRRVVRPARRDPRSRTARTLRIAIRVATFGAACWGLWLAASAAAYRWWPIEHLESLMRDKGRLAEWAYAIHEWRLDREEDKALSSWARIQAELASPGNHEWEGKYFCTYDRSIYCAFGSSDFVVFLNTGCSFSMMSQTRAFSEHGELVRTTPDSAIYRIATPRYSTSSEPPEDREFVRVSWGLRHCVIERYWLEYAKTELPQTIHPWGNPLLLSKVEDLKLPCEGLPDFPPEYRDLLPRPPTPLRITKTWCEELPSEFVNSRLFRVRSVVTIPQMKKPLKPGGGLVVALFGYCQDAEIVHVFGDEALIEYTDYVSDAEQPILPEPGWAFGLIHWDDDDEAGDP